MPFLGSDALLAITMLGMAVAIFWPQEPEEQWASIPSTTEMENKNLTPDQGKTLKKIIGFIIDVIVATTDGKNKKK